MTFQNANFLINENKHWPFTIPLQKTCNGIKDLRPICEFVNKNCLLPLVESSFMAGDDCETVLLKVTRPTLPHLWIKIRERFWLYWTLLKNFRLVTMMVWLGLSMRLCSVPILYNLSAAFLVILNRPLICQMLVMSQCVLARVCLNSLILQFWQLYLFRFSLECSHYIYIECFLQCWQLNFVIIFLIALTGVSVLCVL